MIQKLYRFSIPSTRVFLGLIFFTAGMAKLFADHKFPGLIGPVWLEERLAEHNLGLYARFIAWSQVIAGLTLLSQRFATLGAILTFPIILNIWVVTVSLEWQGTPYVNFVLILLNLHLLIADYPKLKFILSQNVEELKTIPLKRRSAKADGFWALGVGLILLAVLLSNWSLSLGYTVVLGGFLMMISGWWFFDRRRKES
ncbi:DoxX family membrane protein [Fulvivirgaceae bacterium LMO-SS25]